MAAATEGIRRLLFCGALAAGIAVLSGCAGGRPSPRPLGVEIDRYAHDAQEVPPGPRAALLLDEARTRQDQGRRLIGKGRNNQAWPVLRQGAADARAALAVALAERSTERADSCLRDLEDSRHDWQEAIRTLVQTEQIARRTAGGVDPNKSVAGDVTFPELPPTTLGKEPPAGTTADLSRTWNRWIAVAESSGVSTADLVPGFDAELAAAVQGDQAERSVHAYVAGREIQVLESRVRQETSDRVCERARLLAERLAGEQNAALQGVLELERGMKADLRSELEAARAEADNRQQDLYKALQQIQGRFARITREARGTIVSLADILFDFDKATLKRDVEFNLVRVATILNQFPEMDIAIEGHTDNVGAPEYNLELSKARAEAVHEFLIAQGVSVERMTVEGYGMTRPVADNETEEGRARNRRVDLVIQDQPTATPRPSP